VVHRSGVRRQAREHGAASQGEWLANIPRRHTAERHQHRVGDAARGFRATNSPNRFDGARPPRYVGRVEQEPAPNDDRERAWHRLERTLPELIRRAVELGYDKLSEGPENVKNFVSDLRLPKELLQVIISQIEETKTGITRAVAREVHDFLDRSDVTDALVRALSRLSLEVRTEVRFVPQVGGAKPEVRSSVKITTSQPADVPLESPSPASENEQ
jgi:hypothetical protein